MLSLFLHAQRVVGVANVLAEGHRLAQPAFLRLKKKLERLSRHHLMESGQGLSVPSLLPASEG